MKVYEDPTAYTTIQREIERKFHNYIGEEKDNHLNVVIVGACRGEEIQRFLNVYDNIMIVAFEPVPESFKILNETYKNYDNVICLNMAVSDKTGTTTFHEVSVEGCGSLKKFVDDGYNRIVKSFDVSCITLEDVINEAPVDLLWVDTQGTELEVLKGVKNLDNVKSLFLEVTMRNGNIAYEGNCLFDELEAFLSPTHYCHSIGLDNESNNGTGNSFWLKKECHD